MNEHFRPDRLPGTTQAAEGLPRRRWSVAEVEAMVARGIISEDERFELIGGEVVPMCPKGARHEIVRSKLAFYMTRRASEDVMVVAEAQMNLTDDAYVLPDILVHPASINVPDVRGPTALLVVEIADSSLGYDLADQGADLCQLRCSRVLGHRRQDAPHDRIPQAVRLGVFREGGPDGG